MAKSRQVFHPQLKDRATDHEIVQLALLPEHEDLILAIKPSFEDMMSDLQLLIDSGHEITLAANKHTGGYSVLLKASYDIATNHRKCFYSNADDVQMALIVCLFKHFTLAGGGEWVSGSTPAKRTFS